MSEQARPEPVNEGKAPIRGWLIFIAILLWAVAIISPISFFAGFFVPHMSWVSQVVYFVTAVLAVVSLQFFMARKRGFVHYFIALQVWDMISYALSYFTGLNLISTLFGIVVDIVIVLYIVKSKRVKQTFTR